MQELKSCPFCGNTELKIGVQPVGTHYIEYEYSYVKCTKCGTEGPVTENFYPNNGEYYCPSRLKAIELWNKRVEVTE